MGGMETDSLNQNLEIGTYMISTSNVADCCAFARFLSLTTGLSPVELAIMVRQTTFTDAVFILRKAIGAYPLGVDTPKFAPVTSKLLFAAMVYANE